MKFIYNINITESDFVEILKFHYQKYKKYIYAIFGVGFLLNILYDKGLSYNLAISMIVYTIIIIGCYKFLMPWLYKQQYRKQKLLHDERKIIFDKDGFSIETEKFNSFAKYKAIEEIRENNKYILLYTSSNMFHSIPTKVFSSDIDKENFLQFIRDKIENSK